MGTQAPVYSQSEHRDTLDWQLVSEVERGGAALWGWEISDAISRWIVSELNHIVGHSDSIHRESENRLCGKMHTLAVQK